MKHSLLLPIIAGLLALSPLQAQVTITNATFPSIGDTLKTAVDNLPTGILPGSTGGPLSLDFTTLQAPFVRSTPILPPEQVDGYFDFPGATFATSEAGVNTFYRKTASSLTVLGFYGSDPIGLGIEGSFAYSPPLTEFRAPLNYPAANAATTDISYAFAAEDLPAAILDVLPITPDSLRIRLNLQRTDEVDAWGTLTIPGGIYDILRETRTDVQQVRLDARVGFFNWFDVTDIIYELLELPALEPRTSITYRYLSDESVEPIALANTANEGATVAQVTFKANPTVTSLRPEAAAQPGVYAFPNPAIANVRFEFNNLPHGTYTLSLFNILGVREWSETYLIAGNQTEKVNISSLRKGTYFYSLSDSRGKTLATHRLIVVRP
ncbi:T9SS type A sorting domain-containing protein [Phaeodactylibacter luteus]|uniref:T9SS type A sorting domain-containing protein n=1 Tax=Phaeodactylibacter luteus TaxID=1564516 RepID=A0A5C6RIE9_9BACT|nr:T9SS type A sorting domain-containing protein [Phaeodactylibacter luteus]TXB61893.1 T9SS type A sorting domain-containing protein [Phaeodactylibacter luteus]